MYRFLFLSRFSPADTNLVLREFEKCGVILKHIPGPRDANWMHILYQVSFLSCCFKFDKYYFLVNSRNLSIPSFLRALEMMLVLLCQFDTVCLSLSPLVYLDCALPFNKMWYHYLIANGKLKSLLFSPTNKEQMQMELELRR